MAKKLTIDPVTRIEGHLKIETEVEKNKITDARIGGLMYRGMEKILLGRHPFDAARITQRICGICHEVHGIASIMAIEQLYNISPPHNARVLREMILGLHLVGDHLFHFYQLCLPDYIDFSHLQAYQGKDHRIKVAAQHLKIASNSIFSQPANKYLLKDRDLSCELAISYFEALELRRETGAGLAILGGKVPFIHALMPGGLTTSITAGKLQTFVRALRKTRDFVENSYLPQVLLLAQYFPDHFTLGVSTAGLLSYQAFNAGEKALFQSGVYQNGNREAFVASKIKEHCERSFFEQNNKPAAQKKEAYSWIKAPHYAGTPMEVGPFARLMINQDPGFEQLLRDCKQTELRSSVMSRLLARAYESQLLCQYISNLQTAYRMGEPSIVAVNLDQPVTSHGSSYSIAARGALSHEIKATAGKVTDYRLLVPSAWNFGPRVGQQHGVVEAALIETPVDADNRALLSGRIVRSFDPCIACAVH